ncbi:MAG: xylulokinase [Treponema sp.]|jgi:xylulokinase|nr:xylulokinase [Treponema sp.]
MPVLLGIDIGTSSVKAMLADSGGRVIYTAKKSYEVSIPRPGYAEQDPLLWWNAVKGALRLLKQNSPREFENTAAVGFSGQMHGLVLVDRDNKPLRPAIIWLDQRSGEQAALIEKEAGYDTIRRALQNRIFSGFPFPSLLWVRDHEPAVFKRIGAVLFPKDYIRLRMTGIAAAEKTDASASLFFDIGKGEWAWNIITSFFPERNIFPQVFESGECAGYVTKECAAETGLPPGIPVVYGCGDQMAQSIGNGAIYEGCLTSNIGSGGQISAYADQNIYDRELRLHTFCHAVNGGYTVFGATLCAGMSMNWLANKVLHIDDYGRLSKMAGSINPGSDGLVYMPYLAGERTPHMRTDLTGMFHGLALNHDERHFVRAVMEGVVFSLKDAQTLLEGMGITGGKIIAAGGGAMDDVWLQMQADILGKEVYVNKAGEQACLGACILSGIGAGIFKTPAEACSRMVSMEDKTFKPDAKNSEVYQKNYTTYKTLSDFLVRMDAQKKALGE